MKITQDQINSFIKGYLTAALWSSTDTLPSSRDNPDNDGETVNLDDFEWADGEDVKLHGDCVDFIATYEADLLTYAEERNFHPGGYDVWECAGHDFWLTRNGHGVGYWDRCLGELGQRLTAASKTYGCVDLYLGNDELVYVG